MKMISLEQMEKTHGGSLMYCATMWMIINHNELSGGAWEGWNMGWHAGNCGRYSNEQLYWATPWHKLEHY